jgi:hypothetical protein
MAQKTLAQIKEYLRDKELEISSSFVISLVSLVSKNELCKFFNVFFSQC